ncbi:hypothetical protein DERF_011302, partial [Dermatophagoides farinae]
LQQPSSQSSSSSSSSPPELFVSNASSQSTTTTTLTDRDHHSQAIFRSIVECIRIIRCHYNDDDDYNHNQHWINIQSIFDQHNSEIIDNDDELNSPLLIAIYPLKNISY